MRSERPKSLLSIGSKIIPHEKEPPPGGSFFYEEKGTFLLTGEKYGQTEKQGVPIAPPNKNRIARALTRKQICNAGADVLYYTLTHHGVLRFAPKRAEERTAARRQKTPGAMPERAHGVARPSRARGGCDAGQHAVAMSEGRAGARTYGQDRDRRVPTGGGCFFRQMMITARARHAVSVIQTI